MDIFKIKKLIKIIEKSNISELEISEGEKSVRISRINTRNSLNLQDQNKNYNKYKSPSENTIFSSKVFPENKNKQKTTKNNKHIIHSPIIGIFYRSINPEEKPFIEIGQTVKIGDPLCIIEAMKMMNQIKTDKSGVIKNILLKNGETVEFNQPLIIIE